jgi:5-methylcytosine-specific restriction endonuclease McrA
MPKKRGKATARQIGAIASRQGTRCAICGMPLRAQDVEIDHIIPVAHKGSNVARNLRLVHRTCNRSRGKQLVTPNL